MGVLSPFFDTSVKYAGYDLEEYDDAKLTVEQDGSELTFSLFNPQVDMRMVLSDKNVKFKGRHPTPETVSKMGRKFVNVILDEYDDGNIDTDPQLDSSQREFAKRQLQSESESDDNKEQTKLVDAISSPQATEEDDY